MVGQFAIKVYKEAFDFVSQYANAIGTIVLYPLVAIFAIDLAAWPILHQSPPQHPGWVFFLTLIISLLTIKVTIECLRFGMNQSTAKARWTARESWSYFYMLVSSVVASLSALVVAIAFEVCVVMLFSQHVSLTAGFTPDVVIAVVLAVFVNMAILGKMILSAPLVLDGESNCFKQAWRFSRGHALDLGAIIVIPVLFIGFILFTLQKYAPLLIYVPVSLLCTIFVSILMNVALALAYEKLKKGSE